MRIALVVPGGVDRSGEHRVVPVLLALIERLAARHDLTVFALTQEVDPGQWQWAGATVFNIGTRRTRWRAIREILRQSRAAPFDLIQSIWSWQPGMVAVSAARLLRVPSVVHVAGGELVAIRDIAYGGRLTLAGRLRERVVLRGATAVTAASAPILESLSQLGVQARRVPFGVDLKSWPPRPPQRRQSGARARLIHVASLNRVKDQSTLLCALRRLKEMRYEFVLDVVGEDTLQGQIQSLAERLGLASQIKFHGFLTQRELRPLLEHADLMLVSSRHEAGPVALLEAALVGVPTVGTAVGHIAEWSPNAALAVPVGDSAGFANAIANVLDDEALRLRLAEGAFARARQEDADHTARELDAIYQSCVSL